jgi:hypothetical protein
VTSGLDPRSNHTEDSQHLQHGLLPRESSHVACEALARICYVFFYGTALFTWASRISMGMLPFSSNNVWKAARSNASPNRS